MDSETNNMQDRSKIIEELLQKRLQQLKEKYDEEIKMQT